MFQTVADLSEGDELEMSVVRRHVHLFSDLDQRLFLQAVGYHVLDGDDFHVILTGKLHQLRQTGHRAVVVHDLHEGTGRIES